MKKKHWDELPTPLQTFIACRAMKKLSDLGYKNAKSRAKVADDLTSLFKGMRVDHPAQHAWDYVIKDNIRQSRPDATIHDQLRMGMTVHTDIQKAEFDVFLTKEELARAKLAADTHQFKTDRERWLGEMGKSYDGNPNSDDIPDGELITPDTIMGTMYYTSDGFLVKLGRTGKRENEVELEITSLRGVSMGAAHYYANLKCWNIQPAFIITEIGDIDEDRGTKVLKVGDTYGGGGGLYDGWKPRYDRLRNIKVRRPLVKEDRRLAKMYQGEDRYKGYKLGDYIDGFWERPQAIAKAKAVFEEVFDKDRIKLSIEEQE